MTRVTVGCLVYGDYPVLAQKCLQPLVSLRDQGLIDLRVGANEPSVATLEVLKSLGVVNPVVAAPQIFKYPMMRRLFYDKPLTTDYVMWFDDDSFISAPQPDIWLKQLLSKADSSKVISAMGSEYVLNGSLPAKAAEWFKSRFPTALSAPSLNNPKFLTGGWWLMRTPILHELDWPHKDLVHRGGDVGLGIVMRMMGLSFLHYRAGVMINAGETGKESHSPRRGYDEKYPFV